MADTKDLSMILDAKIPIVAIETPDENQVLSLLLRFAMQRHLSFYQWSATRGLRLAGFGAQPDAELNTTSPHDLLAHIARTTGPALYALCDFHPYLNEEPLHIRFLKDIALDFDALQNTIVLISHELKIPPEIGRMTAGFSLSMPTDDELVSLVRAQAKEWSHQHAGRRVKTDQATLDKLIANLRGVSHADARILIRHAIYSDGAVTESDIPEINRLKFELLDAEGVLHFEYDTEQFGNVAGLHNLKRWLILRRKAFIENGADKPRGLLLLGVQGGGKSLAAKSIAGFWGLPLLRLDFGTLYNKFHGETERNLRNSLKQAEMMAPCVLWMDEIEKGLATGNSDNATSKRVLGTLLTWMAEQKKAVFVVATSNDISALPPELVRKGRLDEVFFVDLPDHETRMEIFRIHLSKRDLNPMDFDLAMLADSAEGFTGAEIEQAVVSARYLASSQEQATSVDDLLGALNRTYPLSVLRAESIHGLRAWAEGRTVPA